MHLTLAQKKLIKLLAINCRYTHKELARSIGVSPDTIKYQIDKLHDGEQLFTFAMHIDCRCLGYDYYQFYVTVDSLPESTARVVALPFITFFGKTLGTFDYVGTFVCDSPTRLREYKKAIRKAFGGTVRDLFALRMTKEYKWDNVIEAYQVPVVLPQNPKNPFAASAQEDFGHLSVTQVETDATDAAILAAVADNPRASYVELGTRLSLSHETIRLRLKRLTARGLSLNFSIFTAFEKFGCFAHCALVHVRQFDSRAFERFVKASPFILYAAHYAEQERLLFYTVERDPAEFARHIHAIRVFFGTALLGMELFYFEKMEKNRQFPELFTSVQ